MMIKNNNAGFTLIELMVAITLGLLITAAGVQLLFSSQVSFKMQKGLSEIQDNGNYGLRFITKEIRKTNYGQVNSINDRLEYGGIVLTSAKFPHFPNLSGLSLTDQTVPTNLPRSIKNESENLVSRTGLISNVRTATLSESDTSSEDLKSDQLVIQYYADQAGTDCEGNSFAAGRFIVQRFFVRKDSENKNEDALVLACEAGSYIDGNEQIKRNVSIESLFGSTEGQIILYRVDHFHYLLGVSNQDNTAQKRYMGIDTYLSLDEYPRPRINSIELAILVRSTDNVGNSNVIKDDQSFKVLDQDVQVKNMTVNKKNKYLRQVIKQTIAIRNGLAVVDKAEGI